MNKYIILGRGVDTIYHVAGDLLVLLGDGVVGSTKAVLVNVGAHTQQTVQVVDGDALARHGHLEDIVSNAIRHHFRRSFWNGLV